MRPLIALLLCALSSSALDPTAEQLARAASKAQNSGQLVRAYLLYAEAAARDPLNDKYRLNRESLKPLANLLSKSGIEKPPDTAELIKSAAAESEAPLAPVDIEERREIQKLQPPPKLAPVIGTHGLHARGDERSVFETVARAYGVTVLFEPQFDPHPNIRLDMEDVDFRTAMKALTEETDTFVFAISPTTIFVVRDTPQKRDQFEPQVAVAVPLPDLEDEKNTTEIGNAVRQAFDLRHVGLDPQQRSIVIRGKVSHALAAQALLESLVRPSSQIAIDLEILGVSNSNTVQYGLSLQNTFPLINFGGLGLKQAITSLPQGFTDFLLFGGGRTLYGIGITDAQAFATSTKSWSRSIYQTTVVVSSGQTAEMHIGDKFPIATMLYTGASALPSPFYGPLPQIQQVDLGVKVKVKPVLHPDGDVSMEIHAEYQALGPLTFNTVPEILERQFEGSVRMHGGEWAVLAGLNTQTSSSTRTGIAGLSEVPVVRDFFSVLNKSDQGSEVLFVLKPHALRVETMIEGKSFYYGAQGGRRVLF